MLCAWVRIQLFVHYFLSNKIIEIVEVDSVYFTVVMMKVFKGIVIAVSVVVTKMPGWLTSKLTLVLANTAILHSESHGMHDHILLSDNYGSLRTLPMTLDDDSDCEIFL
jgi:hypothetical protein